MPFPTKDSDWTGLWRRSIAFFPRPVRRFSGSGTLDAFTSTRSRRGKIRVTGWDGSHTGKIQTGRSASNSRPWSSPKWQGAVLATERPSLVRRPVRLQRERPSIDARSCCSCSIFRVFLILEKGTTSGGTNRGNHTAKQ